MTARGTVLVVDDEPQILRLVSRVLARAGLEVLQAANGQEAGKLIESHAQMLDLAILDVIIPPAGAAPLLEKILALCPDLPIILSSGDQLSDGVQALLDQSPRGVFLRKPFLPRALMDLVEDRLNVRMATDGPPAAEGL